MMSAVLKRAGHSTRLILLSTESAAYREDVLEQTAELAAGADLVGLGCYSRCSPKAFQVAARLRRDGVTMVWGGLHASLNPAECAEAAGIVCRGEGEETILEFVQKLEEGRDWRDVRNLAYEQNGSVILNPVRPPLASLDDLPLMDFERTDEYQLGKGEVTRISADPKDSPTVRLQYIGSRGCAFRCTYCCNRKIKELYSNDPKYLRRMSPATYVDQLATLCRERFPKARDLFLMDEDFLMRSVPEIREFCELYRERVGLPFDCMASAPRITEEKLELLAAAGLWRVSLGVESGSERTKKEVFDRPIPNHCITKASHAIRKFPGIAVCYFFIIGNPYERQADLLETVELMTKLACPFYISMYNLVFFPGSELFDRAVRDGVITGSRDSGFELHFRGGLHYQGHAWKQKHVYLNGLLFLTEGKTTRRRLGLVPRAAIPFLTRPGVIEFMERRRGICRIAIWAKVAQLRARSWAGGVLKRLLGNPADAFNLPRLFEKVLLGRRASAERVGAPAAVKRGA